MTKQAYLCIEEAHERKRLTSNERCVLFEINNIVAMLSFLDYMIFIKQILTFVCILRLRKIVGVTPVCDFLPFGFCVIGAFPKALKLTLSRLDSS